jgi:MarR family
MASWGFLTTHARVLLCIAHDPGARLRDIAATLGVTERRAHGIVTDLTQAGYLIRQKDGRRNRYQVQAHLPLPGPGTREPAIGELVALFAARGRPVTGPARASDADASGIRQAQNSLTSGPAGPS